MIGLLLASAFLAQTSNDAALALCKPSLARKAGGQIATIEATSGSDGRRGHMVSGRLTAFLGMGTPGPGNASTHHLIRSDFSFTCRVQAGRVREARVNPLGG